MRDALRLYVTAGSGNSYKPVLVGQQLSLNLNLHFMDVLGGETRQAPFLKINPRGTVPYLLFPDGTGLGESNALAWYFAEGSYLVPEDPLHRAQAIQWMIFEQTELEPNISPARFFTSIVPEKRSLHEDQFPLWMERGHHALLYLNAHLEKQDFVTQAGYSVADIAVFGYTHMAEQGGFDLSRYPAICEWIQRVGRTHHFAPITQLLPVG